MPNRKKIEVSSLKIHIGYWMRLVSNSVSHAFARKLEACEVTVAEWVVLREMYSTNDATSSSGVADLTGLSRGAVSKLISRLLDKGFVERKESTNDRRFQDIKLTSKALQTIPKLANLADKNDQEFFGEISNAEQAQLLSILQKLAKLHQLKTNPIE